MATFYGTSTVTYNNASTPYNGQPITYTYAGSITIVILPKYDLQTVKYYPGRINIDMMVRATYRRGIVRTPTTSGFRVIMAPSSTTVIRKYFKIKDPIRVGGCPQCGTYLYNERV